MVSCCLSNYSVRTFLEGKELVEASVKLALSLKLQAFIRCKLRFVILTIACVYTHSKVIAKGLVGIGLKNPANHV
jgi:hypothetical protein